jgi:hypothetical protein
MLVYKITNRKNGKVYIGKWRKKSVTERWGRHVWGAKHGSEAFLHRAIRKYGSDAFAVEVVYRAKTDDELSKMETFFIILHQSHKPENGYNMTLGGEGTVGSSICEPYREVIQRGVVANHNARMIFNTLQPLGFTGGIQSVRRFVHVLREEDIRDKQQREWNEYLENPTRCQHCDVPIIPKRRGDLTTFKARKYCNRVCANAVNNRRSAAAAA